jgi:LysR family hydrogen peroxide-inducible transcriptional activator
MEETLGERSNKRVLPTELGEHIIASVRRILLEIDNIKALTENVQDPLAGN